MLQVFKTFEQAFSEPLCEEAALPNCGFVLDTPMFTQRRHGRRRGYGAVVPVVPEVATTFAPFAATSAMEVPPVPTIGVFISTAAAKRLIRLYRISGAHYHDPSISPRPDHLSDLRIAFYTEVFTSEVCPEICAVVLLLVFCG